MLQLNIRYLIGLRGVKHPQSYLINNGFSYGEARWLLNEQRKTLSFAMLTRLCKFFGCTPNDLFTWDGKADHPLHSLTKGPVPNIQKILEGKSPSEIEEALRRLANGEG